MGNIKQASTGPCRKVFLLDVGVPYREFEPVKIHHVAVQGKVFVVQGGSHRWLVAHNRGFYARLNKHPFAV